MQGERAVLRESEWDEVVDKTLELYGKPEVVYDREMFTKLTNLEGGGASNAAKLR